MRMERNKRIILSAAITIITYILMTLLLKPLLIQGQTGMMGMMGNISTGQANEMHEGCEKMMGLDGDDETA